MPAVTVHSLNSYCLDVSDIILLFSLIPHLVRVLKVKGVIFYIEHWWVTSPLLHKDNTKIHNSGSIPRSGAGNDPKLFSFFFFFGGGGSLSPPRLNILTVSNMGVMICLGQGGLRSLSASSLSIYLSI